MPEPLAISVHCGPLDDDGKRRVVVVYGKRQHTDRFDTDVSFLREKWRAAAIKSLKIEGQWSPDGGMRDDHIHAELEAKLQAAVEGADDEPTELWQPNVTSMAKVEAMQTDWLWPGSIPAGAITVIDGDPGLGKSQLTVDLAARITRGDCMPPGSAPDGTFKPRGVLICNAEDDPARTLRPRLEAAGANLARVHCLRTMSCAVDEDDRLLSLPNDLHAVESVIRQHDIAAAIFDPFVAFLDSKLSVNNDADVRRCLGQVAAMAEVTGAAVLLVRHLNKKSGLSAVYRGGGSIGITGAARAVFMVGADPVDPDSRIFACVKSNLAPEPQALRFGIESVGGTSRVRWGEHCDVTAHDICQTPREGGKGGGKIDTAKGILEDILANGSRGSNEVEVAMDQAGISKSNYWRARRELGITAEKTEYQGQWLLSMPSINGFHPEF